jgi:catechol 2,3-dioxygenase-like lactoylglutathione lyase family enzyme
MLFKDRYPIFVTPRMRECRDFWIRHFGLVVIFENEWFAYLQAKDGSASIGFLTPDHPSSPPGPETYAGGVSLELEVEDVDAALAELKASGKEPEYPLTDEPFGQRRFGLSDPSGLWINVVQQVAIPG